MFRYLSRVVPMLVLLFLVGACATVTVDLPAVT